MVGAVCTGFPGEKTPSEGCAGIVVKMGCRTSLASPGVKGSTGVLRSLVTVKCTGDVVPVCDGGSAEWCRQGRRFLIPRYACLGNLKTTNTY